MVSKNRSAGPSKQMRKDTKSLTNAVRARRSLQAQSGNTARTDLRQLLPDIRHDAFLRDSLDYTAKAETNRRSHFWSAVKEFVLDLEDDPTIQVRIFPRYAMLFLMALTCYSRYVMMTGSEAQGMLHPDETFQAIEVAHAKVYGYGFDPYGNSKDPLEGQLHSAADDSRPPQPWLYTHVYVLLFYARNFFGWQEAPFVVARNFHATMAATLPFAVYKFTRTVFSQCRDIGFMAATLVAFSKPLMLFGIHSFLQSLTSPILFLTLAVVLRLVASQCSSALQRPKSGTDYTSTPHDFIGGEPIGLFGCGFVLGIVILLQVDSCLLIFLCLLICSIRCPLLNVWPFVRAVAAMIWLISGVVLGTTFAATGDFVHNQRWFDTPLRTVEFLRRNSTSDFGYLRAFLDASHVNVVLIGAAFLISTIYVAHAYDLSDRFEGWIGGDAPEKPLFLSTLKVLATAILLYLFYSYQTHRQARFVHDVTVLTLIAGAAAVYILYRGLYTYIVQIADPKRMTRNIVKLILYAELFLYMFESRMTFPTAINGGIADWAYGRFGESALINQCLLYVGRQPDVDGVVIDYELQMTGGFALIHHNVPIYAKTGFEFREWSLQRRQNVTLHPDILDFLRWQRPNRKTEQSSHVSLATLDEVTDLISLFNVPLMTKTLCEVTSYNYVIVNGGRKFLRKGFREVFNASDTRVYKRSKSRTEREYLLEASSNIPTGTNATVLLYEGLRLVQLKVYNKGLKRLEQVVQLDASKLLAWQLLIFTLEQLKMTDEVGRTLVRCNEVHGSSCSQPVHLFKLDLRTLLPEWNGLPEMREQNISYKFSLPTY